MAIYRAMPEEYVSPVSLAVKAANEAVTAAVLQDDDDLQIAVTPGYYYCEAVLKFQGAEDLVYGFAGPAGTVFDWTDFGLAVSDMATEGNCHVTGEFKTMAGSITVSNTGGTPCIETIWGPLYIDAAGTFKLQWCGAAGAAAVTMLAGTLMRLTRLS